VEITKNNNKYTPAGKAIAFLLMVFFSGLPWWFIDYTTYLNFPIFTIVSTIIIAFSAGFIKATTNHRKREIILVAMGAHQVALIIKMVIDGFADPTNHNMAPIEMLMIMGIDSFLCLIGVSIGNWISIIKEKK
jgi:uncharacterized membrane protein